MAKFINTRKAVSEIDELIRNAGERLILISPYLKLSKDFKELLTYRNNKDKVTTIVFGKQELNPDEMKFLQSLQFISLKYYEDLHAKCYLNDDKMIITSLNLYEFSMANNKEMGVLIDKNDEADLALYDEAYNEVDYIIESSQKFEFGSNQKSFKSKKGSSYRKQADKVVAKLSGFCIRTGVGIPFNIEKPMSFDAYKVWDQYGDYEYPEKFCHFSGEPSYGETCMDRPILKKYWNKAKQHIE